MIPTLKHACGLSTKVGLHSTMSKLGQTLAPNAAKAELCCKLLASRVSVRGVSGCTGGCTRICINCTTKRGINTSNAIDNNAALETKPNLHFNPSIAFPPAKAAAATIRGAQSLPSKVEVTFSNGVKNAYPTIWLRDNCQCPQCFDPRALGRSFLMHDLQPRPTPENVTTSLSGERLDVVWDDGHQSVYLSDWLHQRSFTEEARKKYRNKYQLPKKLWSSDHQLAKYDYLTVMKDDSKLLEWLVTQETWGATMLENTPPEPASAFDLCERVAKVKYTHFGDYSNVVNHPNTNNLAYTNKKLNLHNDMPQYHEIPGLIFLHMIKQHTGPGGDTIISDGLSAAEQMRQRWPLQFEKLVNTDVYFWDKGDAKAEMELTQFYKINKGPTIQLDNSGQITTIRFNNQVRDSFLDLPLDQVDEFYAALKTYFNLMYENSISYKMKGGEMSILDNVRCQHAREAFQGDHGSRHLTTTFMAWDEALCRRRRLQEHFATAG